MRRPLAPTASSSSPRRVLHLRPSSPFGDHPSAFEETLTLEGGRVVSLVPSPRQPRPRLREARGSVPSILWSLSISRRRAGSLSVSDLASIRAGIARPWGALLRQSFLDVCATRGADRVSFFRLLDQLIVSGISRFCVRVDGGSGPV